MNYLLKRQPSPCGIVECLLNNTKHNGTKYCFCGNCFGRHQLFRRSVQECWNSTYASLLKEDVDKKRISGKTDIASKRIDSANHAKKLNELLRVMRPKEGIKKMVLSRRKISTVTVKSSACKSGYNVECTKSYDPNMLNCKLELEELYEPTAKQNDLQEGTDSNYVETLETEEMPYKEFQKINPSQPSSHLKAKCNPDALTLLSIQQKPLTDFVEEPITPSSKENVKEAVSLETLNEINKEKQIFKKKDFDMFSVTLTRSYSVLHYCHSSLDICVRNGMIKEAYALLQSHREKESWQDILSRNYKIIPDVYNLLLYGLSSKGHWYLMKKVTEWMEADKIKLNCESFAAVLHCLTRIRESGNENFVQQELSKTLDSIFQNNISLNDIFCKTRLTKDASEKILKTVREVVPAFEIQPDIMELSSDCSLLKSLHASPGNLQPQLDGLTAKDLQKFVDDQLKIEKNFYLDVKAVSRGRPGEVHLDDKEKLDNLKKQWRETLTKVVDSLQKIKQLEQPFSRNKFDLKIYFCSLPARKVVDILMETTQSIFESSGGYSLSCDQYYRGIGYKIFQCYQLRKKDITGFTDKTENLFKRYISWFANPTGPAMNSRQKWQMVIQESEKSCQLDTHIVKWPEEVLSKIGKVFLNLVIKELTFTLGTDPGATTVPVLYTLMRCRENVFREEIKCHPAVTALFASVGFDTLRFRAEEVPMLCPPKPWKSPEHGGYLFVSTDFIRKPPGLLGKTIRIKDIPVQQLYATFDSLNTLQSVPWNINEDVLDVALEVFKTGGSEKLSVPLFPKKPPEREKFEGVSYEERRKKISERKELVKNLENNYSLWCEALYRLSLAHHFRKKVFWMPQNCDFRGRVYPVPPLLNHLGSDLFRSLLIFAKGKPLGPKGLDWLKIHLINLTGTHKKKSVKSRLDYANEILPEILDSAEKPLTGNKWWMESDEPWQTLASCMELKKALSHPNPETYICRFPVHQDGSCNGLQHYAALGKDLIGAKSVNLFPCDEPQDVYSVVAGLIEQERANDASSGIEIAKVLDGFIGRKVVKQTVMTTVYGVTRYGARLQITKRLEEIPNFPQEYVQTAASYLTEKTFISLRKMFSSAKEIQEWFINCADTICSNNDYVQWMTPLGLPVLQSYAKYRVKPNSRHREIVPDSMKQKNAFPPNFIHSLDSCHMMLTSLYCEQAGLTFAAVHDCFWTHPSTVDTMNTICRQQFISLHSQTILEDLSQFFTKTYVSGRMNDDSAKIFEAVPEKGSFDLKDVMNSVYFFS